MKNYLPTISFIASIGLILGAIFFYSASAGSYDTFAQCIKDSGAKFYGAFWCPHCREQKALFGKSAVNLPYVECSSADGNSQLPVCKERKIEKYPTWFFTSTTTATTTRIDTGLSLEQISEFTQCPLVKDSN